MNWEQTLIKSVRNILIILFAVIIILPILYAFSISFRPLTELYGNPHLIPNHFTLSKYKRFIRLNGRNFTNSLLIATGTTIMTLLIAIPAAYVFARKRFPARRPVFYIIVMTILVPPIMLIFPLTQIFTWINLRGTIFGTWLGVMVTQTPIAIWILRDNFESLPPKIEEAAQVYGCTQFESFVRVVLPLAIPAIIATGFLMFLYAWIDFLFTNLLTTGKTEPIIVVIYQRFDPERHIRYPYMLAGSFLVALPPLVLYTAAQRYLEKALTT